MPDKQGEKRVVEDAARDKRPEKASKVDKSDGNEKGRDDRPTRWNTLDISWS